MKKKTHLFKFFEIYHQTRTSFDNKNLGLGLLYRRGVNLKKVFHVFSLNKHIIHQKLILIFKMFKKYSRITYDGVILESRT